jgi:hypothetical protein
MFCLAFQGVDGIPAMETAGNVLRPETALKLSIRLPPTVKPAPVRDIALLGIELFAPRCKLTDCGLRTLLCSRNASCASCAMNRIAR